jgi:hypothetical protein
MFETFGPGDEEACPYCRYARGLAYARLGMHEAAEADWKLCLPAMVRTLRIPSAGKMFEYADNPLIRYREYEPSEQEIVVNMINRLRLITGESFGYDPAAEDNEQAIAAWEQWFESSGRVRFSPDAEMIVFPKATEEAGV